MVVNGGLVYHSDSVDRELCMNRLLTLCSGQDVFRDKLILGLADGTNVRLDLCIGGVERI